MKTVPEIERPSRELQGKNQRLHWRTKTRTHPSTWLALANVDEWTGEGGVENIAVRILKLKEFEGK